jgi:hypothetical protein
MNFMRSVIHPPNTLSFILYRFPVKIEFGIPVITAPFLMGLRQKQIEFRLLFAPRKFLFALGNFKNTSFAT